MNERVLVIGFLSMVFCTGCSSEIETAEPQAVSAPAEDGAPGFVSFEVDGTERQYDYLPRSRNFYYSVASAVSAKPSVDAAEELTINFLSVDLKKLKYPTVLPAPRATDGLLDPISAAASTVGIIYINGEGQEWGGPARVAIESIDSMGILTGSFTNASLPHGEKQLPNAILLNGRVKVKISDKW